jgi:hypothetical protein
LVAAVPLAAIVPAESAAIVPKLVSEDETMAAGRAVPVREPAGAEPPMERLATGVVEAITKGAVPVDTVLVICPDADIVVKDPDADTLLART